MIIIKPSIYRVFNSLHGSLEFLFSWETDTHRRQCVSYLRGGIHIVLFTAAFLAPRVGFWYAVCTQCENLEVLAAQSCQTLCEPMNCSPPASSVHGIFQARILEWVAISFCRGSSWPRDQTCMSCISCMGGSLPLAPPGKPPTYTTTYKIDN